MVSRMATPVSVSGIPETFAFSTETLLITVGPGKAAFNVHRGKLAATSFFEYHQNHPGLQVAQKTVSDTATDAVDVIDVKPESDVERLRHMPSDREADYHVQDQHFWTPAAFEIFVKWLYRENIGLIQKRGECLQYLQAYVLAMKYEVPGLQNIMIDRLRFWHQDNKVNVDHLKWIVNRMNRAGGRGTSTLTGYLIDQIAYDVCSEGYSKYAENNATLTKFLCEDTWKVREDLVAAIASVAKSAIEGRKVEDPAHGRKTYHVDE